ncbi:hypothetical protein F960_02738 [Acinetobacter gerneri DSM 14967 = CIP 107464 = MTCC 9824]|uniref:Uncharacterized protein n=1 Tax=Acinetobacter gerneri DSM 14967 = CIP 107464 = MTCC 9824 TaxID=1120926 RepID=N8Y8Q2_9GAMM|nr:hypothetical protein F960_02738 [Acinetobacter gerneri DSM 14967 = CIP 107464 = MTCC 9824]
MTKQKDSQTKPHQKPPVIKDGPTLVTSLEGRKIVDHKTVKDDRK